MTKYKNALTIVAGALALGIAPDPIVLPSAWASENLIVADGPQSGQKWSPELTPYAVEILDCLSSTTAFTRVSVRKSAQVGLTEVGIAWIGSVIDNTPARVMAVFPTISTVLDFNRDKLAPTFEQTPSLKRKVLQYKSRGGSGSTERNKRFPGGSLVLTGANSAADLRSKTVKFAFCDEVDEWPIDLKEQGDPMEMVDARQTAFHATGDYKKFETSTPRVKGISRIDAAFEEGDQRYWHVPCPHCGEYQRLEFGGKDKLYGLKFNTVYPYQAHYICMHCGAEIEHYQKREMVQAGKWVPAMPEPGRHPSFHIDSLSSLLTTWDKIAEKFLKSKDDPIKLKGFTNLSLGEAWEERGDAPEWDRLYARRQNYARRLIPEGGLVLTCAADVQGDGVYYEVVAWGRGQESWSVDVGFLIGDTSDAKNAVWKDFEKVIYSPYPDMYGNLRQIDLIGVDSGYNTQAVYEFTRKHPKVLALKGLDGWGRPAIGTATDQDVDIRGKKKRRGVKVWGVGTWSLKSKFYANLRQKGIADGELENPAGYCHFSEFHDDGYFKQITAEYLKDVQSKGRINREWWARGPNHYLDCRIYNMAIAAHPMLQVPDLTESDWSQLSRERAVPAEGAQGDLEALIHVVAPPVAATSRSQEEPQDRRAHDEDDSGGDFIPLRDDWLSR